jgi:hypothetical protein
MEVLKGTIFGNECDEIKFINMLKKFINYIFGIIFMKN